MRVLNRNKTYAELLESCKGDTRKAGNVIRKLSRDENPGLCDMACCLCQEPRSKGNCDIAHVVGIDEYKNNNPEMLVSEINVRSNLRAMCKSCHAGFDDQWNPQRKAIYRELELEISKIHETNNERIRSLWASIDKLPDRTEFQRLKELLK